jgi:hypothetical protein
MRTLRVTAATAAAALLLAMTAAATQATPGPSPCRTSGLVIWIASGQGAAGSFFYTLDFTNQSGSTCTLSGYPGVSAVSLRGHRLGSAAARDTSRKVRTITLSDGATASTTLHIVDVLNFTASSCRPADAAGVRVYPPKQSHSKVVPLPFKACTSKVGFMRVQAVRPASS